MADELDLVRAFRSDIPGPSTDAWARARAALGVPEHPLREVAYKARARRRWVLTLGLLGVASGTAATVSVLALGGSATAFAGWSATPAIPTADQSATTQDNCEADLPAHLAQGSWSQVATDVRGPYSLAVYKSGTSLASCLTGPSFTTVQAESLVSDNAMVSASGGPAPETAGSSGLHLLSGGAVEQLAVSHFSQTANGVYTLVEGRLAPTVSAVTLILGDGQDVTATAGSGWLVAWWPGSEEVTAAQITTASGQTTDPLTQVPVPTPPALPGDGHPGGMTAVPANGATVGTLGTGSGQ